MEIFRLLVLFIMSVSPTKKIDAMIYANSIINASQEFDLDWRELTAIIMHESQFRPKLVSKTNDYGISQHHCPSMFCKKIPTNQQMMCLMDAECNIHLLAMELMEKKAFCQRLGSCTDYIQLYNPLSKGYSDKIKKIREKIRKFEDHNRAS